MANKKDINTLEDRFKLLPQDIIQHIQSFMDGSEAARTTLLSKYWYGAWSTRPYLDFTRCMFRSDDAFAEFANKTVQRYEDWNLKIECLKLHMPGTGSDLSLAKELIVKAMKLGAVDLNINLFNRSFVLPEEVFQSKSLTRLYLYGVTVHLHTQVITYSQLKSLNLAGVVVRGDLYRELIQRCRLIEELTLNATVSCCYDQTVEMRHEFDNNKFEIDNKLKYLNLSGVDINVTLCRDDFMPRFRCLKELVIFCDRYDYIGVTFCSTSIERISIRLSPSKMLDAEFDVPNLRKFKFEGSPKSRLDFRKTRGSRDVNVHIRCLHYEASAEWFYWLNQLVYMLRQCMLKVDLTVDVKFPLENDDNYFGAMVPAADVPPATISMVEYLVLEGFEATPAFLDILFFSSLPKFIVTQPQSYTGPDHSIFKYRDENPFTLFGW